MKKESGLVELLDALWHRACALLMMQVSIEAGEFAEAMGCQVEYLYWTDEISRMFPEHGDHLVALVTVAMGYRYLEE